MRSTTGVHSAISNDHKKKEPVYIVKLPSLTDSPCTRIQKDFLSFTIDTSLLLGGHWWGNSKKIIKGVASDRVKNLDLANTTLIAYARSLSPAMLRIGGTEADRVRYKPGTKAVIDFYGRATIKEDSPREEKSDESSTYEYILKKDLWKNLHEFLGKIRMSLLFTVSAGLSDRDANGVWQEENARKIIAYSLKKKYRVAAWEFGNEINGFPFIYGWKHRVTPAQYTRDFARFGHLIRSVDPTSRILGPASAFWPKIGEPFPMIRKLCNSPAAVFLDAVSWHYYPQQSSRGKIATKKAGVHTMLSSRAMNGILAWNRKIRFAQDAANKRRSNLSATENWLTETGHALYGGERGISDTFVSTLWWIDELGLLAREGTTKVFRQALIGSDYGLLDQNTFEPRPDFYASFLWKRLMGELVFIPEYVPTTDTKMRMYIHRNNSEKTTTLLCINVDRKKSKRILVKEISGQKSAAAEKYLLQGIGVITSKGISVNGIKIEDDLVFKWEKKKTFIKYGIIHPSKRVYDEDFVMPPLSILFVRYFSFQ